MPQHATTLSLPFIIIFGLTACDKNVQKKAGPAAIERTENPIEDVMIGSNLAWKIHQSLSLVSSSRYNYTSCTDSSGIEQSVETDGTLFEVRFYTISSKQNFDKACPPVLTTQTKSITNEDWDRLKTALSQLVIQKSTLKDCYQDGLYAGISLETINQNEPDDSAFVHILPKSEVSCAGDLETSADWLSLSKLFASIFENGARTPEL